MGRLGFSLAKARILIGLAWGGGSGTLDLDVLAQVDDERAAALVTVPGIGRWRAEFVLLRGLGHLGVPGDNGARNYLRRPFELPAFASSTRSPP